MRRLFLNRSEPAKKSGQNIPKNRCRTTIAERMMETLAELPFYWGSGRLLKPRTRPPAAERDLLELPSRRSAGQSKSDVSAWQKDLPKARKCALRWPLPAAWRCPE